MPEVTGHRNAWQAGPAEDFPLVVTVTSECHTFMDLDGVKGDRDTETKVRSCRQAASAGSVLGWERSYPGLPGQAGEVRAALRAFLDGCPAADDVIQLVSELAANAVLYSGSGKPGGQFTVRVRDHKGDHVHAEVEDQGSTWHADLARSARPPHGLYLLQMMSAACGATGHPHARLVWFTISYPREPAPDHRAPLCIGR